MKTEIKVPILPDQTESAFIADIYVKDGDIVVTDQALKDIETDKVVLEVIAPNCGIVCGLSLLQGQSVASEQTLFWLEPSDQIILEKPQTTVCESKDEAPSKSKNILGYVFAGLAVAILILLFF
jgi:pyruvate/2-oxoglutarate dehydrogenase complex dihydrolipoamide acyltransferase (E2) component